jgi:hypothetical protein
LKTDGARLAAALTLTFLSALTPFPLHAQTAGTPPDNRFEVRLRSDSYLREFAGRRPFTNFFGEVDLDGSLRVHDRVFVAAVTRLEQQRSTVATSGFQFEAAYVQALWAGLDLDPVRAWAGKYHPAFGRAWSLGSGFFSRDYAYDYELLEKLGFGGSVDLRFLGTHTLAAELFAQDTTQLSKAIGSQTVFGSRGFYRPKRNHTDYGLAGNTGQLDSYALTLTGADAGGVPGLAYQIGYAEQSGQPRLGEQDERLAVLSLSWRGEVFPGWTLSPLAETVQQQNRFGRAPTAQITTLATGIDGPAGWSFALHSAWRQWSRATPVQNGMDYLAGFTVGNDITQSVWTDAPGFARGLTLSLGYKAQREVDPALNRRNTQHVVGTEIRLTKLF